MKIILLATTLLSIAMSENILMGNHLKPKTLWIRDKQFWNKKIKRLLHGDAPSEIEDLVNYDDDRQLPRISDARFISETNKVPIAVVRRSNMARYSQVDLSSDKPKVENAKPTILISIGIQERKKTSEDLQDDCSKTAKKNYRKYNQHRQIQEPFYVEEPRWIEIDPEYKDSSRHLNGDPYILTRGKKIFRIEDSEEGDKTIEDYEFIDYPSKMASMKNRVRRSVEINKNYQDSTVKENNDEKEINHHNFLRDINKDTNNIDTIKTKNRDKKFSRIDKKSEDRKTNKKKDVSVPHNVSIKKYKKDKLKDLAKQPPRKFTKKNQISDDVIVTNFVDQDQKIQRENDPNNIVNHNSTANESERFNNKSHFASGTNKRNKRSALLKNRKFSEDPKRYKTYEIDWVDVSSKKSAEKNGTDVFEQNKVYIDKLDDLSTYDDPFILSRGKDLLDSGRNSSNKNDANHKFIEKLWKIKYYAHRKKLENEEEARNEMNKLEADNDDTGTTDSQLTDKFDSKTFGIKNYPNNREKRNACETCKMGSQFQEELWWKNIEKNIQDSSFERRDKHGDILEGLRLTEPYIISRGKKALHEFKDSFFRMLKRNKNDANHAKMKSLLNMILTEKYNNDNYDTNVAELSNDKISPRDRRGELDEILAPYDPYYVARGKRANLNNFLTKARLLRN
ncbi:DNA ligase 1-like [Linepithema humile]|uniref:DNA ligase 1-like n=1 Tax=Linepithema humile TaxID=83485 RepID=UPI00351E8140